MTGIYLPEAQDDKLARDQFLNYSVSDNLDVLGATLEETFYYNPFVALSRQMVLKHQQKIGNKLGKDEWTASDYYRDGLVYPEDGFTEGAAKAIAQSYDQRQERKEIFSRAEGGIGMGVARFGVSLVGSMLDPLNIASAFVPGAAIRSFVNARRAIKAGDKINKTRLMQQSLFKSGETGKRIAYGGVEGMAGAALVEPLILSTAEAEQDKDYTILDSFLNVTIGGVLGGGLHAVGGKISDKMLQAKRETVETVLNASLAQKNSGRPVEINALLNADGNLKQRQFDPRFDEPKIVNFADEKSVVRTLDDIDSEFKLDIKTKGVQLPDIISPKIKPPKRFSTWLRERKIDPNDRMIGEFDEKIRRGASLYKKQGGQSIDVLAGDATDAGYFYTRPTEGEFIEALQEDILGNKRYSELDELELRTYRQAVELKRYADENGINYRGVSDEDFMAQIRQNDEFNAYYEEMMGRTEIEDGISTEDFNAALEEQRSIKNQYDEAVDPESFAFFDEPPQPIRDLDLKELDVEQQQLLNEVEHLQKSNLITDVDAEEIRIANQDVERAETSFGSAAEAAARCLVR
tara:strand:- start:4288 stop:6015 length:1728 start_codon:yes stop_codon:yes gene_type:complete